MILHDKGEIFIRVSLWHIIIKVVKETHLAPGSVQYLDLGSNIIDRNAVPVEEICNRVERD